MQNANFLDIFSDDAFSSVTLSAAISNIDTVPGAAGKHAFDGVGEGVPSLSVGIERVGEALTLIRENPRGAPAPKEEKDKRSLVNLNIAHIPLEAEIHADEVQNVPDYSASLGATNGYFQMMTVEKVVSDYLAKMASRFDYTMEFLRLGAIKGQVVGGSGNVLVDLFEELGVQNSDGQYAPEVVAFDLENYNPNHHIRVVCQELIRFMKRNAKTTIPGKAFVMAFCGDNFFDKLVSHPSVKDVYAGTDSAIERLGGNYAGGTPFEFGDIVFVNYAGSDDNATIAIPTDEARFFYHGVPGLFAEYYAPADFMETVNTKGLPRYAKIATDKRFNQRVELHVQTNPLPLCLRPKTLVRGVSEAPSD